MEENTPRQRLSRSQKTDKWGKEMIDHLERLSQSEQFNGRSSRSKKQIFYDLYNGKINMKDFEYVLNPYGFKENQFPAELRHYDIITPKINLLLGEELDRPFNFRAVATNPEAISAYEEDKKNFVLENLRGYMAAKMNANDPELAKEYESVLKNLDKTMKYSYSDMRELFAQHSLNYLRKEQELDWKLNQGFKDGLLVGEELYWVGILNGEPSMRLVNPLDLTIISDPDSDFIDDAYAIIEERWLTVSSTIDEFYKDLTPKQISQLEKGTSMGFGKDSYSHNTAQIIMSFEGETKASPQASNQKKSSNTIRILKCEWASLRKVGFLYTTDEYGREDVELVDEVFELPEDATKDSEGYYHFEEGKLKWEWIKEYWEGHKIDKDIYINIRPKQNQRRNIDNPTICKSGYTGMIYSARNSVSVSSMERAYQWQCFYDIIMYRLETALGKDKGKVAIMDIAQIPQGENWDVDKWMYYLDALGIMFVNSHEEGPRGETNHQFNQFTSIDLTLGNYINTHVSLLSVIEERVGTVLGVSEQRQGQVQTSELVGNVERSIQQSSHITEYLFFMHNEVKRRVLDSLLDVARITWREGKKLNYVGDDLSREFLEIDGTDFANTQYGVFVSNSSKDTKNLERMRSLLETAVQADKIAMSDAAGVLTSDSMVQMKKELERSEENRNKQQQENQKQSEERLAQMEQAKIEDKQLDRDLDREKNIRDNETKLIISSKGDIELPEDNSLDYDKLDLERKKHSDKINLEKEKLDHMKRKTVKELELKKEDLQIKRSKPKIQS